MGAVGITVLSPCSESLRKGAARKYLVVKEATVRLTILAVLAKSPCKCTPTLKYTPPPNNTPKQRRRPTQLSPRAHAAIPRKKRTGLPPGLRGRRSGFLGASSIENLGNIFFTRNPRGVGPQNPGKKEVQVVQGGLLLPFFGSVPRPAVQPSIPRYLLQTPLVSNHELNHETPLQIARKCDS